MPIIVTMPALSPTMEEGIISSWLVKEGDKVEDGDPICEIATDKSTVEFQVVDGGYLRKILTPINGSAKVNAPIAVITQTLDEDISSLILEVKKQDVKVEAVIDETKALETKTSSFGLNIMSFSPPPAKDKIRSMKKTSLNASPLAKKIAVEKGLDISSIKGTGPSGRIIAKDLEFAPKTMTFSKRETYLYPDGTFEEIALTPIRKIIGDRLQASKMTIPHYVVSQTVNMTKIISLRSELKDLGIKATFNDFVIKAAALALKKHPNINMGYDSAKNVLIEYKTIDIALAVSIPDGLITPILWQVDYMSLSQISLEAKNLALKAKQGTLEPGMYQGGSFTISNLGMFGITSFQAVINPPQAAILGVGGIFEAAISLDGKISSGFLMNISVSMDHRVIDGAEGAQFLNSIKFFLENPVSLVI